jgi:hypothetical protein
MGVGGASGFGAKGGASGASGGTTGGGSAGAAGLGGTGGASGTAGGGGVASAGPCAGFVAKATPDQVAKTPRANHTAEVLAVETLGTFVADDALYQRVASEVEAIALLAPQTASIMPVSFASDSQLLLTLDAPGLQSYQSGSYHGWDCANAAYGENKDALVSTTLPLVLVAFANKIYNTPVLAKEYAMLPDVAGAEPSSGSIDGPDVCLQIDGDVHSYIYDQAGGDCPAGCTTHLYFGFEAKVGTAVQPLGTYDPAVPPEPTWFTKLKDCRSRL